MVVDKAMIIAGIGCRKNTSAEAVVAAIHSALSHHGLATAQLDALATVPQKRDERGIQIAAERLGLGLVVATEMELRAAEGGTLSFSQVSLDATGTASASEAAALAVAGFGSRLMGPRIAIGPVTCAIAINGDAP
jgi:cobalt-precorrin 5A hydrolase